MSRDVLRQLSDPGVISRRVAADEWPRTFLAAAPVPDGWLALVERADGRRRLVPAGQDPRFDPGDAALLIRSAPATVTVDLRDVPAACGTPVSATCEWTLRWAARDDDLAAAARFFAGQSPARADWLSERAAQAGGLTGLTKFIRSREAAALVREDLRDECLAAMREALARFCFECGATVESLTRLRFASSALTARETAAESARARLERIQSRELLEQASLAATHKRLDSLGGLLDKLKNSAAGATGAQWHDLLPALAPAERATLLENLWRITPDRRATSALVVVAGQEIAWIDPSGGHAITRRAALPTTLGGLRSVWFDAARNQLLVGAATGIFVVDDNTGGIVQACSTGVAAAPRTGFNTARVISDSIYATSSALGLWCWPRSDSASTGAGVGGRALLTPESGVPKTIRGLAAAPDGRVLLAADDCVHAYDPRTGEIAVLGAADDSIHCLELIDHTLIVGTADGKLLRMDIRQPEDWWMPYRGADPIESICVRRWADVVELLIAAGPRGVLGVFDEEAVVTRVLESPVPIRRCWAGDDIVVGLSDARDRLVIMHAGSPGRSGRDVPIARMLGNSVQDVALVTRAADPTADSC